jgi:hypothetical protein
MSDSLRRVAAPLALLSLVAALLLWSGRLSSDASPARASAPAAVPASQAVGRVVFQTTPSTSRTLTIRSFGWSGVSTGSGFTPGNPTINLDASSFSPALTKALAVGTHWPSVTVVLYQPGTTTRFEQWKFYEVQVRELRASQAGPPSRLPREQVTWTWNVVRRDVYAANGTTIAATVCYNRQTLTTTCPAL